MRDLYEGRLSEDMDTTRNDRVGHVCHFGLWPTEAARGGYPVAATEHV